MHQSQDHSDSDIYHSNSALVSYLNNDYKRKLASLNINPQVVSAALLNLTKDTCSELLNRRDPEEQLSGYTTVNSFIHMIAQRIPNPVHSADFSRIFSLEHLRDTYEKGQLSHSCMYMTARKNGRRRWISTFAEVLQNPSTGDLEAIMYAIDTTQSYVEKMVAHYVFSNSYAMIGILDLPQNRLSTFSYLSDTISSVLSEEILIDTFFWQYCARQVAAEHQDRFLKNASMNTIREQLKKGGSYVFHSRTFDTGGKRHFMQYTFSYLHTHLEIVLMQVKDVTNDMGRDELTGELNRRGFLEYLDMLQHSGRDLTQYAILYLDLLDFKAINEMIGTVGGDEILRKVAATLRSSFLKPIVLAHITGSGHFLCLLEKQQLDVSRMPEILHHSWSYEEHPIDIFSQCGIFIIEDTAMTPAGMCDCAKLAMKPIVDTYAKPYAFYTQDLKKEYIARASVVAELKHALVNNEFQVYYQPIYDAKTHHIVSAEALIRWISPRKGIVSPGEFIPILEENGHISKLDLFVTQSVERFLDQRRLAQKSVIPVSVNLSGMDFHDKSTLETLLETSNRLGKDSNLRFEITETTYVSMSRENSEATNRIREAGTKLLIDDFGSGYSSFSIITNYDFDILKLDIGFIRKIGVNPKSEKIIAAIIDMAHSINVKVIAEGAETKEQVDFLVKCNCDYIQGYYFSRPLPQDAFEELLDRTTFQKA